MGWFRQRFFGERQDATADAAALTRLEEHAELRLAQAAYAEAAQCYRDILAKRPGSAHAHARLGVALKALGRTDEARQSAERALSLEADQADAHYLLAGIEAANPAAHAHYAQAIAAAPAFEAPYLDWCRLLFQENRLDEAAALVEQGLAHLPESVHLRLYLGNLRHTQGRFAEAVGEYEKAAALLPESAAILANVGLAQLMACRYDVATSTLQRALELDPGSIDANISLGRAWLDQGNYEAARRSFERAQELDPDHVVAPYNLSHLALLLGDFESGWEGFRLRDRQPGMVRNPDLPQPLFSLDADVSGKTVFLHAEQGYGDTLQFIRYAALVASRGARVIVSVPAPLRTLVANATGVAEVAQPDAPVEFDYHSPLLSLPDVFGTRLESVPHAIPYLRVLPARIEHWRGQLGARTRPQTRVGLVWSGDPRKNHVVAHHLDTMRSLRLSQLAPLIDLAHHLGLELHSLQLGTEAHSQLADYPQIVDHAGALFDFQETAALIEQLDLVISVDTSVAHLAGAVGKPVWLLNRYNTCWRWLLEREDSPWYPGMRIFRQPRLGDWDSVIAEVKDALAGFAQSAHGQ